jgi:hypothetical protein
MKNALWAMAWSVVKAAGGGLDAGPCQDASGWID